MNTLWWWCLCLSLGLAGCGKDPLSDRVDNLEGQVAELQAQTLATQQVLLAQLDQIAITADNEAAVAAIRAKLGQATLTQTDLTSLQAQIDALGRQVVNWTAPATQAGPAVYAVMYGIFSSTNKSQIDLTDSTRVTLTFLGTAFAAGDQTLVTNGHMVDGLLAMDTQLKQRNARRKTNLQGAWIVVQNQTTTLRYQQNYFFIGGYATHPGWSSSDYSSVDVGTLRVQEGTLASKLKVIPASEALALKTGQPIATLGFPGELQGDPRDNFYPIATFKDGTISALRPAQSGLTHRASDTYIVQHNLDLSGGTSGSPILNPAGMVVAVNNAGIESSVGSTQVSQAALGFGIRADKIQEVLARPQAAKLVPAATGLWRWLEGRELKEAVMDAGGESLDQRLDRLEGGW